MDKDWADELHGIKGISPLNVISDHEVMSNLHKQKKRL